MGRPEANIVRIIIVNFEHKRKILNHVHKLKDLEGYNQVYISPDLTIEHTKKRVVKGKLELRNTGRYKNAQLKIRRGQVIQIAGGEEVLVLYSVRQD